MTGLLSRSFSWIARHERPLGAVLFIAGFATDVIAFTLLSVDLVNLAFLGYLALAAAATFGTHVLASRPMAALVGWRRVLQVLLPLAAQYAIGGILSGCLIFYTKSSVVDASWPFLLLLALVFIGNEYFRLYREYLAFQAILFFFGLYAYAIFALPLALGRLGAPLFLGSTAIAMGLFVVFVGILWLVGRHRLLASLRIIVIGVTVTVVLVVGAYFARVIPPIPLSLKEAGVYHQVTRTEGGYVLMDERQPEWWEFSEPTLHVVPGSPVYAYSAVFAPVAFSAGVVHRWEVETESGWVERSRVAFPISGGRSDGYRGYSVTGQVTPGRWRVSIETPDGQVVGRIGFTAVAATEVPPLTMSVR